MDKRKQEEFYNEIIKFYDLAEDAITAIEAKGVKHPELQVKLIEPVIKQVEESTEMMSEAYIEYTYNDCKTNPKIVKKIETAVRKLFSAIVGFINKVKALPMYISNAKQKLKSELLEEQVKISGILKELSLNLKGVRSGPNRRSLNEIMVACPELVITKNVMSCGDHLELMTRAFLSLGLITDLHAVEPGSREANLGQSLSRD